MKSRCMLCLLLLAGSGAVLAGGAPAAGAEAQIRAALAGWVDAANRGDYAAAMSVWAPDLIGWAPQGPDDTYERELAGSKAPPPQPVLTTYALVVNEVIVDATLAVVRDTWTQTTAMPDGTHKAETFRSFEVWRRQADGGWKIARWIDGPLLPAKTG